MKKSSTYGLRLDQMKSLFAMGRQEPNPGNEKNGNQEMADFLREQLTGRLPKGTVFCDVLVMMMEQQGYDILSLTGRSLGEVLLSNKTSIDLLQVIKECAKALSTTLDSPAEMALATTIYYVAIASALVHHNTKITTNAYEKLHDSLDMLIEKKWMAKELIDLFSRARRVCAEKGASQ